MSLKLAQRIITKSKLSVLFFSLSLLLISCGGSLSKDLKPNFLFIMTDDQSWIHTSKAGYPLIATPNFDHLANEGLYFENAFVSAPSCTPSRSAVLTGQHFWRLESGAVLHGDYPDKEVTYQQLLAAAGYQTGYTGKGWGPGNIAPKSRDIAGKPYLDKTKLVADHYSPIDLSANLEDFLNDVNDKPFSFWIGAIDPHRPYDIAAKNRFSNEQSLSLIPDFLPPSSRVQTELSAYLDEIEHFDVDLGKILDVLDRTGKLENTLIVVTSDNGMPFSRAKTNNYNYGVQVPLAIYWSKQKQKSLDIPDFVSLTDIAPTFLDLANIAIPEAMTGQSLKPYLLNQQTLIKNQKRTRAFTGYERHASNSRGSEGNLTYPRRAIHTSKFVLIKNFLPDRWPSGDEPRFIEAYPHLLKDPQGIKLEPYFSLATAKRPEFELYDLRTDPYQLTNLAYEASYGAILLDLEAQLMTELARTDDPIFINPSYFEQFR